MKKSVLKLIAFSIIPFLVICYAVYLTGEKTDDFYKRFTSSAQSSLILGSSRGSSIDPAILNQIISEKNPDIKFYNYAFTWGHSPYGPKYFESIKKKLNPETVNGIFILIVEPTALMVNRKSPDEPKYYFENDRSVATTYFPNLNPNLEYLLKSYDYSITRVLNQKIIPPKNPMAEVEVLDNGKVEVTMIKEFNPEKRQAENDRKMVEFQKRIDDLKWSEKRLAYLDQTIKFLLQHGKVLLIRMPISDVPYKIENAAVPYFDSKMDQLALLNNINYTNYNLRNHSYKCTDEVHLNKESIKKFTIELGIQLRGK